MANKVGLGIVTYQRPDFLEKAVESVDEHLGSQLDYKIIHDDCSPIDLGVAEGFHERGWEVYLSKENVGVAEAKNRLLRAMMAEGMDYLFLMEDDIEVISPETLKRYIGAIERTNLHTLMFHGHGSQNKKPNVKDDVVTGWPNCVGAFQVYTRRAIEAVGYLRPEFGNALDHVEHTYRLTMAGLCSPWRVFPDVTGSKELLREQAGSEVPELWDPECAFQKSLQLWYKTTPMPSDLMSFLR